MYSEAKFRDAWKLKQPEDPSILKAALAKPSDPSTSQEYFKEWLNALLRMSQCVARMMIPTSPHNGVMEAVLKHTSFPSEVSLFTKRVALEVLGNLIRLSAKKAKLARSYADHVQLCKDVFIQCLQSDIATQRV
ncbi:hypothetical protein M422DRAFT_263624 [Sphaerobolus stellatus SS14]|uniref:Uncharacterized protein n=1 Tax=Sphaerobolus stellatus (strain SS14) TaxID=990650 RepID=A0A0C9VAE0_SPHS4|nr:hypothetical protein M422DRAFT_263624 [Sphaerobolus stellatus SS14]